MPHLFLIDQDLPIVQAGAVIWRNDRIVLRRTRHGHWLFPKGHLEPDESTVETARREAEEETGLLVEVQDRLGRVLLHQQHRTLDLDLFVARAIGDGPAWLRHLGQDTFLARPEQVSTQLSYPELRRFWATHYARIQAWQLSGRSVRLVAPVRAFAGRSAETIRGPWRS